jgi:hypothetical protein
MSLFLPPLRLKSISFYHIWAHWLSRPWPEWQLQPLHPQRQILFAGTSALPPGQPACLNWVTPAYSKYHFTHSSWFTIRCFCQSLHVSSSCDLDWSELFVCNGRFSPRYCAARLPKRIQFNRLTFRIWRLSFRLAVQSNFSRLRFAASPAARTAITVSTMEPMASLTFDLKYASVETIRLGNWRLKLLMLLVRSLQQARRIFVYLIRAGKLISCSLMIVA